MAPQGSPSADDKDVGRHEQVSHIVAQASASGNGTASVDASARAHEQSLTASTEADKNNNPNPSNTVSTFVSPAERENTKSSEKEKDKDKGSLATTVQTQQNTTSTATSGSTRRFSRKSKPASKATKSSTASSRFAPEKVVASNSHPREENKSLKSSQKKESFIAKFVRKLVPCVAPSDRTHVIDIDVDDATRPGVADAANGRPAPAVDVGVTGEKQNEPKEPELEKPTPLAIDVSPPPTQTSAAEVDVIVPPTPIKALLPISETEGVTSGAVQPPGSTGTDIFSPSPPSHLDTPHTTTPGTQSHAGDTLHTATDSEGSFTDEEAHGEAEEPEVEEVEPMEEDDEDALILNGGAGIPIGPVSFIWSFRRL
jgi:RNA polymerase II subunit A small phosphatase-like protein